MVAVELNGKLRSIRSLVRRCLGWENVNLVQPATQYLASYCAALRRGWSPNTLRAAAAVEELQDIERDPLVFFGFADGLRGMGPAGRVARRL